MSKPIAREFYIKSGTKPYAKRRTVLNAPQVSSDGFEVVHVIELLSGHKLISREMFQATKSKALQRLWRGEITDVWTEIELELFGPADGVK